MKVYKLMRLGADGKLYPLFIDAALPTELLRWYDAVSPNLSMLRDKAPGIYLVNPDTGEVQTREEFNAEHPDMKPVDYDWPHESGKEYNPESGLSFREGDDEKSDLADMSVRERTVKVAESIDRLKAYKETEKARFVDGWQRCRDKEWKEMQRSEGILNAKAVEILGKKRARWSDLYNLSTKRSGVILWWDGGRMKEHEVTQGNLIISIW